jgi:hypothetical protein
MKNLFKERRQGRILGPFTHEEVHKRWGFFRSNPMGSVVNNDGSLRMINDLSYPRNNKGQPTKKRKDEESGKESDDEDEDEDTYSDGANKIIKHLTYDQIEEETPSVNSFVDKLDFMTTWDDFKKVEGYFKTLPGVKLLLAIVDWLKAYRQGSTHHSQWRYLTIKDFNGNIWVDTRIPFGGVAGCGTFGWMADAWKEIIMKLLNVREVFRWVDDSMFIKCEGDELNMEDVLGITKDMGVQSNNEKFSNWAVEQKYLGFIWNGEDRSVRLPKEKLEERIFKIKELITMERKCSKKEIEKLTGQLSHITSLLPHLKSYLWHMYRFDKSWYNFKALRDMPEEVRVELQEWLQALTAFDRRVIRPDLEPEDVGWVGDASTGYGIGVLVGDRWSRFKLVENWKTKNLSQERKNRDIAWLETVTVRLGLRVVEQLFPTANRKFIVYSDNTTTQAAITNKKSKHRLVNEEWQLIQKELTRLNCDLTVKRVSSGENDADKLSRGTRTKGEEKSEVLVQVPIDLAELLIRD